MTIEDDIAFLERIPVLRRLGAPALRILAIGAEGYRVEQGQVLFNAGDVGSFVSAITGLFPVQATTDSNDAITLQKKS